MAKRSGVLELAVLGLLHESPDARLRAAQAAQRPARHLPRASLRLALPLPEAPARPRAGSARTPTATRRAGLGRQRGADRLPAHRRGQGALPGTCSPRPGRPPGRTSASASTSRSSPAPTPTSGCASSRAGAAGSRSGSTTLRVAAARTRERLDSYTLELQRHGLESVEREVRWLNELIATERGRRTDPPHDSRAPTGAAERHVRGRDTRPPTMNEEEVPWVRSASPSSASATAPRRSSRASSTTRTPTRRPRSRA